MTHQPGVYVPLRALFLVLNACFIFLWNSGIFEFNHENLAFSEYMGHSPTPP